MSRLRTTFVACASALGLAACGRGDVAPASAESASATARPEATTVEATAAVVVVDAWARPADRGANTAVYLTVVNATTARDSVTGVSTTLAESASLHESVQQGGMMHMRSVRALVISAGDTLRLAPLGAHVMVMHLTRALAVGDTLPVVITFGSGRALDVSAVVRAP